MSHCSGFTEKDCLKLYQKAISQMSTITLHVAKVMTIGSPQVGKTNLRHLLLGLSPPTVSVSTPLMKTAETMVSVLPPSEKPGDMKERLLPDKGECLAQICSEKGCVNTDLVYLTSEGGKSKWVGVNEASGLQSFLSFLFTVYTDLKSSAKLASDEKAPDIQVTSVQSVSNMALEGSAPDVQITSQANAPMTSPAFSEVAPQDVTAIAHQLFQLLQHPDVQNVHFPDATLVQFVDCGGQLAYYDILPLFTTISSIYLHVFKLTEDLMDYPIDRIQIHGNECELYSKAISPVTTAQMISRSVMTIKSLAGKKGNLPVGVLQSEPSDPRIILVGTHLDVVEAMSKEKAQMKKKIEDINDTLRKALKSDVCGLEEMILKNSTPPLPSMFFPVNNRLYTEENEGQQSEIAVLAINRLKKRIEDQVSCMKVKVPVKWYLFQLLKTSQSKEGSKPVYKYCELYHSCQIVADVGEFHAMVTYFNALGLFVHLCGEDVKHTEESTCFIFTDPTYLSEAVSKLYQVQFLDEDRCEGGLLNLKRRGLLTKQSLQELQVDDIHLKHSEFMELLVQLFIGAEIESGNGDKNMELFIPSVLTQPTGGQSSVLHSEFLESQPHFVITFKDVAFIPCGVFVGAITRLLKAKTWKLSKESISRIHIPFAVGACDNVRLLDCATHIRVVMAVSDGHKARAYRDTILDAIAKSYCFCFHRKSSEDDQSTSCKECHCSPFLILGLTCRTCRSEANHIALLCLEDSNCKTVRCQETHNAEFLSTEQQLLFQNMEHFVSLLSVKHEGAVSRH